MKPEKNIEYEKNLDVLLELTVALKNVYMHTDLLVTSFELGLPLILSNGSQFNDHSVHNQCKLNRHQFESCVTFCFKTSIVNSFI